MIGGIIIAIMLLIIAIKVICGFNKKPVELPCYEMDIKTPILPQGSNMSEQNLTTRQKEYCRDADDPEELVELDFQRVEESYEELMALMTPDDFDIETDESVVVQAQEELREQEEAEGLYLLSLAELES